MEETRQTHTSETLKLITRGRRTNLPHIVRLRFAAKDGFVYLLSASERSDWLLNSIYLKRVKVKIGNYVYEAEVAKGDKEYALALFLKKYGSHVVSSWYSNSKSCLKLKIIGKIISSKGEFEASTDFDEWKKNNNNYYRGISEAFDSASEEYDFTINSNRINRWIRKRSIDLILKYVNKNSILLEIGCGTGEEAIKIVSHVKKIVATDISCKMIELLNLKIKGRSLQDKIVPIRVAASGIAELANLFLMDKFDLAYSLNGALNCELKINLFPKSLSGLIKPNGYFICSIRNSVCASEMLSHLFAFQFDKCTPRKKQPMMVSVGGKDIPAFYYKPEEFARFFKPWFEVRRIIALPAIIPPAYLSEYFVKLGPIARIAEKLDSFISEIPLMNLLGDQTLFVFQKSG